MEWCVNPKANCLQVAVRCVIESVILEWCVNPELFASGREMCHKKGDSIALRCSASDGMSSLCFIRRPFLLSKLTSIIVQL